MTQQKQPDIIDNSGIDPITNFSNNPSFQDVVHARMARRSFLKGSLAAAVSGILGVGLTACSSSDTAEPLPPVNVAPAPSLLGFTAIAANRADAVTVPAGYTAKPFLAWGTPITDTYPAFLEDATNTAAEQAMQMGMNHDGMHFFPIDMRNGGESSTEGLLVMNHEYVEPNVMHPQGPEVPRPAEQAAKEIAGHGVSVVHIEKTAQGEWQVVVNSPFNRRITGETPMELTGPVRGHTKVVTKYSVDGSRTRGTLNNCAHGFTPWGTYLTAEENWAGYFMNSDETQVREHRRYGVGRSNGRYFWETATPAADRFSRFNASTIAGSASEDYRNEPNTFGWIVEIDPFNPESIPQKRTALGRFAHEGIVFANVTEGEPLVAYSGDDSQNEYIYKYVSKAPYYKNTAGGHL